MPFSAHLWDYTHDLNIPKVWRFFSYGNWEHVSSQTQTQHLCSLFSKYSAYLNHPNLDNKSRSTLKQYLLIPLYIIPSSHLKFVVFTSSTCSDKALFPESLSIYSNPQISYHATQFTMTGEKYHSKTTDFSILFGRSFKTWLHT